MVFSTFILRYVESKFTLLTYLMENNTVITVISYCTKGLNNSKQNKSLSLPYTTSPLKAEFLVWLKGVNYCGVLFCGFFFSAETNFCGSAKFAKIRTRKIFMLRGMGQYSKHRFFKKSKIPFSNLSSIYSAELYLGPKIKKTAWQRPFFLTFFSKAVARELEHIETV